MPTLPRRPAAQRERDRLQARRLRAAELFTAGMRQAEVARQLGVSALAVSVWHARWRAGGVEALHSRGPSGPGPRLSDQQLAEVEQALLKGATANGFTGELWTLERIGVVIERLTGVRHHPAWVWALLHHRLGWTVQRPSTGPPSATRRRSTAGSRNAGRGFCKRPTTQSLPGLLRRDRAQPDPNVRRTWAPRGQPPTLTHPFNCKKASMAAALCYGVRGGGAQLCLHVTPGNYDTDTLTEVLSELRQFLGWGAGHPALGRAARASQPSDAGLAGDPAVLAGGGAAIRLCAGAEPDGGAVVQPQGRRVGQSHFAGPDRGDRPGSQGRRPGASHAAFGYSFLRHAGLSVS
jgi:transposase